MWREVPTIEAVQSMKCFLLRMISSTEGKMADVIVHAEEAQMEDFCLMTSLVH